MVNAFMESPYLWLTVTVGLYLLAARLQRRWPTPLLTPLLFAIVMIILLLLVLDIPYETYEAGGKLISTFVTPATVALAIKLEKNYVYLQKHYNAMLMGIIIGFILKMVMIVVFVFFFYYDI